MIRFTLQQRSDQIRKKLEAGYVMPPPDRLRNNGSRRTERKRELLQTIEDAAAAQGREAPFKARF